MTIRRPQPTLHLATRIPVFGAAALLAGGVALAGCGAAEKQDAPHADAASVDRSQPDLVIAMPDDYRNVVSKCDGFGHRVYVTSHASDQPSAVAVIADPRCGNAR
jgi:hypothetical protein